MSVTSPCIWECGDVIRVVGLYLGFVPPTCSLVLSILWLFIAIDGKIHVLCVLTFTLLYIHFPLWTLIDSFVWNEIVHGISCDNSGWYHQYDAYSLPIRWSRVTLSYSPGSVSFACSPILSVSFEGMGCEPILNLAASPDETVSIICTVVNKTILLTLWGKLMYVSYTTDRPVFIRASCRCSSYNLSLGTFNMIDLRLWDACQDDVAPGKFLLVQCACQLFFWTGHINSCMFMINYWSLYHQVAC